jgi:hypothetical protein
MNNQSNNRSRQGRIPATLQAVFLASNRGKDVNKPPPEKAASKVYFRNWLFQRQAGSKEKRGSLFGGVGKKGKKNKKSKNAPVPIAVKLPKPNVCKVSSSIKVESASSISICRHYLTLASSFHCSLYSPQHPHWPLRFTWMP